MREIETTKKGKIRSNRKNYFNILINDLPLTGGLFIDITTDDAVMMINGKVVEITQSDINAFRTYFAEEYKLYNAEHVYQALESVMAINTVTNYERKTYKRVGVWFDYINQLEGDVLLDKLILREIIEGPSERVIDGLYNALLLQATEKGIAKEFKRTWRQVVKEEKRLEKFLEGNRLVFRGLEHSAEDNDDLPF